MKPSSIILLISVCIILSFIYRYNKNKFPNNTPTMSNSVILDSNFEDNMTSKNYFDSSYDSESLLQGGEMYNFIKQANTNNAKFYEPLTTYYDTILLDASVVYDTIKNTFVGFSYEKANLLDSTTNPFFKSLYLVNLFANFDHPGFIRLGGTSVDSTVWYTDAGANPDTFSFLKTYQVIYFRQFLDSINTHDSSSAYWKAIWALPVYPYRLDTAANGYIKYVRKEASSVHDSLTTSRLMTFIAGNEPNTYGPPTFSYSDFYPIYKRYWDTLAANLNRDTIMSGPATTRGSAFTNLQPMFKNFTDCTANISGATKATLFDIHNYHFHYPDNLTTYDSAKELVKPEVFDSLNIWIDSVKNHVGSKPWFIDEGNVVGGLPGDTLFGPSTSFASALWALNNMWILASKGCSGWAAHTSANLNPSFPIGFDRNAVLASNAFSPRPTYYAMLEFQEGVYGTAASTPGVFIKNTKLFHTPDAELYVYSCNESASDKYMITVINTGVDITNLRIRCVQSLSNFGYKVTLTPESGTGGNLGSQTAYIGHQIVDGNNILNQSATHESIYPTGDYYEISLKKGTAVVLKIGY